MTDHANRHIAVDVQDTATSDAFSSTYRNYVLAILMLVYMVNVVDRNILTITLQPIKVELGLSDTQLGALTGFAFAIFYAVFAIPIAMWADRGSRRKVLTVTLSVFSTTTVMCAFATSFFQLIVARIFTAIGEAGTNPCAHSMISDMYPPQKRASALAFYSLGTNMGILLGFIVGGWISQWYGWRVAFFVVGVPGLLLAIVAWFTLKEPVRGHADSLTAQGARAAPGIVNVWQFLWSQHSFRHIMYGVVISAIGISSINIWFPAFLVRSYGMSSGEIGTVLAFLFGIVGGGGTLLSGYMADRLGKRDVRWNVWMVAIVNAICFPFCVVMFSVDAKILVLMLFIYPALAFSAYLPPLIAMTHALSAVRMRAQATGIFFLFQSMVGVSLGPQLTGILSDFYLPVYGQESLRRALLIMSVFWIWSSLHFVLAARTLKSDIDRVRGPAVTTL